MNVYLVGGAVRDKLLGQAVKEKDWVVVGSTEKEMLEKGFRQVGKDFPVFLHPKTNEEYALARTERKTGKGYTGFVCHAAPDVTLEDDLKRRDLTINAIAETENGELIDPYGGTQDLEKCVLRHVSEAFVEDPLRILRVARFAARFAHLGFTIAEETQQLMLKMGREGDVENLVPERIWRELHRSLKLDQPQVFIQVLRQCGVLKILFPELDVCYGVPNPPQWHPEVDTGVHVELALEAAAQLTEEPRVRFAVLVHDLGKGMTPIEDWPSHKDHGKKGVPLIQALSKRCRVPKDYRELAILTSQFHIQTHNCREMTPKAIIHLLEQLDAYRRPERFEQFLLACEADVKGRMGVENKPYEAGIYLKEQLKASSKIDVQAIINQGLEGEAIKDEIHNQRIKALKV